MSGINNITIGIVKPNRSSSGSGSDGENGENGFPIPFLDLKLVERGSINGVKNTGARKYGDFVQGMKDATTMWKSAMFLGGNENDRNNYVPIVEIVINEAIEIPEENPEIPDENPYVPPVIPYVPPVIPITTPDYSAANYSLDYSIN